MNQSSKKQSNGFNEMKAAPETLKYSVIACDVFKEELESLGGEKPPWSGIQYLEMGLHDQPDLLRKSISIALRKLEMNASIEAIVFVYGLCGTGLVGISPSRCPIIIPRAHDCVSILLGSPKRHSEILQKYPEAYFYSPGWVRGKRAPGPDREKHLRAFYTQRYGDDQELVDELLEADKESFAHHNCAAYVDLTQNEKAEDYCKSCAHSLGWKFRKLEGDPRLLHDLLYGPWDDKRFLIVQPGRSIALSTDSKVLREQ
ncbi:hypothetical protein VDG1235_2825 [Verrucomicrobiia bacterium DG1235]|nr:hypothetical protein VDG1235_2825 [Verrucomicrobiae bacterium DG1235]